MSLGVVPHVDKQVNEKTLAIRVVESVTGYPNEWITRLKLCLSSPLTAKVDRHVSYMARI